MQDVLSSGSTLRVLRQYALDCENIHWAKIPVNTLVFRKCFTYLGILQGCCCRVQTDVAFEVVLDLRADAANGHCCARVCNLYGCS